MNQPVGKIPARETNTFVIRPATVADAETVGWHRARMFQDIGMVPAELFEEYRARCATQVRDSLENGDYFGWLIGDPNDARKIIAGAGVGLRQISPIAIPDPKGKPTIYDRGQALIMNVYTEPAWRRRGLARKLTEEVIAWCRAREIRSVVLHASEDGRALYEQLGFVRTNEMRLNA